MKPTIKEIKAEIVEGKIFDLKIGKLTIVSIEKDSYRKGDDRIRTTINDKNFADDRAEIARFIKSNL